VRHRRNLPGAAAVWKGTPVKVESAEPAAPAVAVLLLATRPDLLAAALDALAASADPGVPVELAVVISGCGEDAERIVAERAPRAAVLRTEANAGTAAAWNLAAAMTRAPLIATIHEDTQVRPGWLAALIAARDADPRLRIVGPRLLLPDGTLQNDGWLLWSDGYVTGVHDSSAPGTSARTTPRAVDLVSSAAMLVDRATLDAVGGFDERYHPAVYVEVDLCMTVRALGGVVASVPDVPVVHRTGAMVREGSALASPEYRDHLIERNRLRFAAKWGDRLAGQHDASAVAPRERWGATADAAAALALAERGAAGGAVAEDIPRPVRPITGQGIAPLEVAPGRWRLPPEADLRLAQAELGTRATFLEELLTVARNGRAAGARVQELEAERNALAERLAASESARTALESERAALRAQVDGHEAGRPGTEGELIRLREREATLERIVAGRWWRLRGALQRVVPGWR
jgi:GT2 family glycosyltransferase